MKYYYLPFIPLSDVNYIYILSLYRVAKYNNKTNLFDTIKYTSIRNLSEVLNIPYSTLSRILNNTEYNNFIDIDKINKVIILKNNFSSKANSRSFVRLTSEEVELIFKVNDNLFSKYLIYIKYYCGYANNKSDFTAKQFLSTFGYSELSNSYISKVSLYNSILVDNNIIEINKYRDELGHTRNIYSVV